MRQNSKPRRPAALPCTIPDDVMRDGILWEPDWAEILLANARVRQTLLEQEVRLTAERDRAEWLARQTERLAAIALELDELERRLKMAEERERRETWWREVSEREKQANAKILEHFQDQLDGGVHAAMVARANKAKAEMDRDNARLERVAFLKRGVLRGTRKQPAAGRLAY
jgi:hypothetical protein